MEVTQLSLPHAHRYRLPEPNGMYCEARCECGATKTLSNVFTQDLPGQAPKPITVSRLPRPERGWSHGTEYGWATKRCRCEPCVGAHEAKLARGRERAKRSVA